MIIINSIIIFYIISVYMSYKLIQKAYSEGGKWYPLKPDILDIFFVIFPLYNTVSVILFLLEGRGKNIPNNFFKIKKEE